MYSKAVSVGTCPTARAVETGVHFCTSDLRLTHCLYGNANGSHSQADFDTLFSINHS